MFIAKSVAQFMLKRLCERGVKGTALASKALQPCRREPTKAYTGSLLERDVKAELPTGIYLLASHVKRILIRRRIRAVSRSSVFDALYFSLGTQATVGYGDIVPTSPWIMMSAVLQAMSGLALLLAALSWNLSIGRALSVPLARPPSNPC